MLWKYPLENITGLHAFIVKRGNKTFACRFALLDECVFYSEAESVYKLNVTKSIDVDYFVKYTSADPKIVTVDDKGVLEVVGIGETYVLVECAGISKRINVSVENLSVDGISFDGVISDGEYVGEVITAANANLSAKISGMIKNGNLYMAFELDHGAWSSLNNDWWMNDNVEFKLNGGTSHTVVFYEGVPTYSSNITHGVSRTVEKNGRLIKLNACRKNNLHK